MPTPGDMRPRSTRKRGGTLDAAPCLMLEVVVEDGDWGPEDALQRLVQRAAEAMVETPAVREHLVGPASACIAFADDAAVRTLNAHYRGQDKPTNVLSFPIPAANMGRGQPPGLPRALGDVVLAAGTVAAEATEREMPIDHHVQHLVVHGVLHLLGYDHRTQDEAAVMEALETRILAALGVPDPYRSDD